MFDRDFDDLIAGESFATRGRTITEADVVGFATLTGDMHPLHVDAAWAKDGPFRERIAHGLLIASYAAGLVPFDPERVLALRRVRDVVFKRPVRLGDTIRVDGVVAKLSPLSGDAGLVTCDWRVLNQWERLVCRMTVEILWRRDAAALAGDQLGALEPEFVPIPL